MQNPAAADRTGQLTAPHPIGPHHRLRASEMSLLPMRGAIVAPVKGRKLHESCTQSADRFSNPALAVLTSSRRQTRIRIMQRNAQRNEMARVTRENCEAIMLRRGGDDQASEAWRAAD
jgi:hypothetical protein